MMSRPRNGVREMDGGFQSDVSEEEVRRERAKARELRNSQWWKRRRASGICHYCGKKFSPRELTMDHVVPIIRGGKASKGNCVPACKECNSAKKYLLPWEWEEKMKGGHQ